MSARLKAGGIANDEIVVRFTTHLPQPPAWKAPVSVVQRVVLILIAGLVVSYAAWLASRCRLNGRYTFEGRGTVTVNKRMKRLGTSWHAPAIWIWGTRAGARMRVGRLPFPLGTTPINPVKNAGLVTTAAGRAS